MQCTYRLWNKLRAHRELASPPLYYVKKNQPTQASKASEPMAEAEVHLLEQIHVAPAARTPVLGAPHHLFDDLAWLFMDSVERLFFYPHVDRAAVFPLPSCRTCSPASSRSPVPSSAPPPAASPTQTPWCARPRPRRVNGGLQLAWVWDYPSFTASRW